MASFPKIEFETYQWLLQQLNQLRLHDNGKADNQELAFIKEEDWLSETAVIEQISKRNGTWCIDLLFAYQPDPLRLIVRKITTETSQKKATLLATIFRRQAAKDQRGTLLIRLEDHTIYNN